MEGQVPSLTENQSQQSEPFCVAPFINFYYKGSKFRSLLRPCCESRTDSVDEIADYQEYWNGEFLQEVRRDMLSNKPHNICNRCVAVESSGGFNARKFYKNILKKSEGTKKEKIEFNVKTGNQFGSPLSIDYRGSNLCNLKCRMCHPASSSEIAKEVLTNSESFKRINISTTNSFLYKENKNVNTFINQIPLKNISRIKFLGGEPLLQEDVYQGLEKVLLESDNPLDVDIAFTTNATNFPKRFTDIIEKFGRVLMRVSLDGVDETYEYVRTNGDWKTIKDNCIKMFEKNYSKHRVSMGFSFVIQAYNAFNIIDILEFCMDIKKLNYSIWVDPYFSPIEQDFLSTKVLYKEDKDYIISQLDNFKKRYPNQNFSTDVKNIIENFDTNRKVDDKDLRSQFKEFTLVMDNIRKTELKNINERFEKYL